VIAKLPSRYSLARPIIQQFAGHFAGRRVLVTGHTGFKGSWLCFWLSELGAQVTGISSDIPTKPSNFEVLGLADRIDHRIGDVRDPRVLRETLDAAQPEVVLHLAAQSLVRKAYDEPRLTFETNVMGVVNMLDALRHSTSVRSAVIVTSDKCYENVGWDYGYREDDRLGGPDPYSASKAAAEIAFSSYNRSFISKTPVRAATGRAGNVIGGGDWAADRIVPDCVRAWSEGRAPKIRAPRATRPWQHVLEPLSGYLWLAAALLEDRPAVAGESFNFGPAAENDHTVADLIEEMRRTWAGPSYELEGDGGKVEASLLKLCCDKALRRLAWQPTLTFAEAARFTAAWYESYYGGTPMTDATRAQLSEYVELAHQRSRVWTHV
jgi:CDP-glucose 4,6-dehydratase